MSTLSRVADHFTQQRRPHETVQRDQVKVKAPVTAAQPVIKPSSSSASTKSDYIRLLAVAARAGTIGWESLSDAEVLLRKFDMNLAFGPATGITRLDRYKRAKTMGLQPPEYIPTLLEPVMAATGAGSKAAAAPSRSSSSSSSAAAVTIPHFDKQGTGSHSVFHTAVHGALASTS